jgi:hypothetical protein
MEVESRTRRTHSSLFNMQGANQPKSVGLNSLGDADFNHQYLEYVSLINLALFILKKKKF